MVVDEDISGAAKIKFLYQFAPPEIDGEACYYVYKC